MGHFPMLAIMHFAAILLHLATYVAAAIYAYLDAHHEFVPIYACACIATCLHMAVVVCEERRKMKCEANDRTTGGDFAD